MLPSQQLQQMMGSHRQQIHGNYQQQYQQTAQYQQQIQQQLYIQQQLQASRKTRGAPDWAEL
jgi:hypothetical protein